MPRLMVYDLTWVCCSVIETREKRNGLVLELELSISDELRKESPPVQNCWVTQAERRQLHEIASGLLEMHHNHSEREYVGEKLFLSAGCVKVAHWEEFLILYNHFEQLVYQL